MHPKIIIGKEIINQTNTELKNIIVKSPNKIINNDPKISLQKATKTKNKNIIHGQALGRFLSIPTSFDPERTAKTSQDTETTNNKIFTKYFIIFISIYILLYHIKT